MKKEPEKPGKALAGVFSQDIVNQLNVVFSRMDGKLQLDLHLDSRPVSQELKSYMLELAKYTDKLTVREREAAEDASSFLPYVEVKNASGQSCGLAFHGVPGGHEFTSFILGLYKAGRTGDSQLAPEIREKTRPSVIRSKCRFWHPCPVPCARILSWQPRELRR